MSDCSHSIMNRLLTQSLFLLTLTGIFGWNAAFGIHSRTSLFEQLDDTEQVVEIEEGVEDESFGSDGSAGFGDGDLPERLTTPGTALFQINQTSVRLFSLSASIRQSQVNLLNSFRAPAIFILFHSYQGYLS